MKKFLTYLLALAALFSVAVSCNDEDDIKPGEPDLDDCYKVYFPVQELTGLEIEPSADKTLTVIAAREVTYGAITVPVELTNDYDGIFSIDDIVFADGQSESETTLYFEDAEIGVDYSFSIQVTDPQFGSLYGENIPILDVALAVVKWNLLTETEKALYTDDFFTTFYTTGNLTWEVDVEERDDKPGLFRILYPYDEKYAWNDPGDWDTSKDYNLIIDATDPEGVFIEQQEIGVDWGYGMISVQSVGWYDYAYGYTWDAIKAAGECGTFKDMVVTFPTNMLLINMPEYSSGWYYANTNGAFRLSLPGAANYSISVTAVSDDFDVTATVTFSEDVESARVAIFEGTDIDSAVSAIEKGTVEYEELSVSGDVTYTVETAGRYSVVAVSYAEGEAKESGYATVTVTDPTETWTKYGEGNYSYSGFCFGGDDPGLEIYQSDLDKTRFKIEHWGADTDFIFEWDQDANEIYVEDQYTGYDYGNYGAVNVCDLSDSEDWGELIYYVPTGYYNDGTFYFAVEYNNDNIGWFGFGYEAFTLDGYTAGTSLSDVLGTFYAYEYSVAYAGLYGSYYVIEESDDPDYDIMFTMFDYYDCDQGSIYGTYDEDTGIAEFECDQLFGYDSGYYLAASLYYYYEYYPVTFRFFKNGDFWGPFYGDYISEDAYMSLFGSLMYIGAWDAMAFLYCENLGVQPNSIKPASACINEHPERTEPFDKSKLAKKSVSSNFKPVPAVKNASSAKTSSVSEDSSKFSKKTLKNPVPVTSMH